MVRPLRRPAVQLQSVRHETRGAGEIMTVRDDIDRAMAERFLAALDPGATRFTFQTFDDSKDRMDRRMARILHGSIDEHIDALARLNAAGAGVFVTVNETNFQGRAAANVVRVRALFVDLDGAPLPVSGPAPHIVVETSPRRWHVY